MAMKVAVFSTKPYDRDHLEQANQGRHEFVYHEVALKPNNALLAQGCQAVCCFVNDQLEARALGITLARVPEYSSHAIAETTLANLTHFEQGEMDRVCSID